MEAIMPQMVSLPDDFCIVHLVHDGDVFLNAKKLPGMGDLMTDIFDSPKRKAATISSSAFEKGRSWLVSALYQGYGGGKFTIFGDCTLTDVISFYKVLKDKFKLAIVWPSKNWKMRSTREMALRYLRKQRNSTWLIPRRVCFIDVFHHWFFYRCSDLSGSVLFALQTQFQKSAWSVSSGSQRLLFTGVQLRQSVLFWYCPYHGLKLCGYGLSAIYLSCFMDFLATGALFVHLSGWFN